MKPVKNKFHCVACRRPKMIFSTRQEALRFLRYNADDIERQTGRRPVRAYYCYCCGGWHITSHRHSHDMKDLSKRFGRERAEEIRTVISETIGLKVSVSRGIQRLLKDLSHDLGYEQINAAKCKAQIDSLCALFDAVISAELETRGTINPLFQRFQALCDLYLHKLPTALADSAA